MQGLTVNLVESLFGHLSSVSFGLFQVFDSICVPVNYIPGHSVMQQGSSPSGCRVPPVKKNDKPHRRLDIASTFPQRGLADTRSLLD